MRASLMLFAVLVSGCGESPASIRQREELAKNGCTLAVVERTGRQIYCGKACWATEYRRIYRCNGFNLERVGT